MLSFVHNPNVITTECTCWGPMLTFLPLSLLFFFLFLFTDSLLQWKSEGKAAVWLRVPISLSRCAAAASTHGFAFHHAKDDYAILALWLGEGESRLPGFATHQVGVAGTDRNTLKET